MSDNYDTSGFSFTIQLEEAKRKFQTSIIISQDKMKSGVLSFLSEDGTASQNENAVVDDVPPSSDSGNSGGY